MATADRPGVEAGPYDVTGLNEDPEFRCYDGEPHDFRDVGGRLDCRRGCGAEVLLGDDGYPLLD